MSPGEPHRYHPDYDNTDIKRWTESFWELDPARNERRAAYLGSGELLEDMPAPLLAIERECMHQADALPGPDDKADTLVILVGESFEPLLHIIAAFDPKRLVPVLSTHYGDRDPNTGNGSHRTGQAQWMALRSWVRAMAHLPVQHKPSHLDALAHTEVEPVVDSAGAVFAYLVEALQDDLRQKKRIVLDITGAKKTMVAGAFQFAAYTNVPITYLDFDSYHPGNRRPYGFSCRIVNVDNPFRDWALREWNDIKRLYEHGLYLPAIHLLQNLPNLPTEQWKKGLTWLKAFLRVCEAWDRNDYPSAARLMSQLPSELKEVVPYAVTELASVWPNANPGARTAVAAVNSLLAQFDGSVTDRRVALFSSNKLMIYAEDEICRVHRLLSGQNDSEEIERPDYRAAFQRAYGLYEFLLKARVWTLHVKGALEVTPSSEGNGPRRNEVNKWILNKMLSWQATRLLNNGGSVEVIHPGRSPFNLQRKNGEPNITLLQEVDLGSDEQFLKKLPDFRNKVTHEHLPVPEIVVEKLVGLLRKFIDGYRQHWAPLNDTGLDVATIPTADCGSYAAPSWEDLRQLCGLDFLF